MVVSVRDLTLLEKDMLENEATRLEKDLTLLEKELILERDPMPLWREHILPLERDNLRNMPVREATVTGREKDAIVTDRERDVGRVREKEREFGEKIQEIRSDVRRVEIERGRGRWRERERKSEIVGGIGRERKRES
uniref:Uncharacterized protein n=1 Tax=Cacopsylla melanoneura TaxID=428564 RepID=A0A8D8SFC3_9HEMI